MPKTWRTNRPRTQVDDISLASNLCSSYRYSHPFTRRELLIRPEEKGSSRHTVKHLIMSYSLSLKDILPQEKRTFIVKLRVKIQPGSIKCLFIFCTHTKLTLPWVTFWWLYSHNLLGGISFLSLIRDLKIAVYLDGSHLSQVFCSPWKVLWFYCFLFFNHLSWGCFNSGVKVQDCPWRAKSSVVVLWCCTYPNPSVQPESSLHRLWFCIYSTFVTTTKGCCK